MKYKQWMQFSVVVLAFLAIGAIEPFSPRRSIDMGGNKIVNVGPASSSGDATPKSYVDAKTWGVASGGTGFTSATAYGLLAGGTTSTGAFQSLDTGTEGQTLVSVGSSGLPTWQTRVLEITTAGTGTWTNPRTISGNTFTRVVIQQTGGGGGGGGGRLSVAGTAGSGGGGGGGGCFVEWETALANLPDTVPYSVGGGGIGGGPGFSVTGTAGTAGASTTFGDTSGALYYEALGGNGGSGGTTTTTTGGSARAAGSLVRAGQYNSTAGASGTNGTVPGQVTFTITSIAGPTSGGGGAGCSAAGTAAAGGRAGRYVQTSVIKVATEGGSAAGGAIATNGQSGSSATSGFTHWEGCGGGGGGGAGAGQTAGNGGAGYRGGGGGGGGGASGASANAGTGGNGGDGLLRFYYYLKRDLPVRRSRLDSFSLAF